MRHATTGEHNGPHAHGGEALRNSLSEGIATFHGGLRWQVGVDKDREHRSLVAQMSQWNTDRIVDFGRTGKRGVESEAIKTTYQFQADGAGYIPVKRVSCEFSIGFTANVKGEGWRNLVKKLFGMVV